MIDFLTDLLFLLLFFNCFCICYLIWRSSIPRFLFILSMSDLCIITCIIIGLLVGMKSPIFLWIYLILLTIKTVSTSIYILYNLYLVLQNKYAGKVLSNKID